MKKITSVLALLLAISMMATTGFAAEGEAAGESAGEAGAESAGESASDSGDSSSDGELANNGSPVSFEDSAITIYDAVDYTYVAAEGEQVALSTVIKPIIEVDGLQFRDLDEDGELDVYEDWRQDSSTRADDLISQMTNSEKARMLFQADLPTTMGSAETAEEDGEYTVWWFITQCGGTHFLNNNYKGTPDNMANAHNQVQAIAEENRLGIPVTITSDRMYNVWAGYIDSAHDAFGTAHDTETASKLWTLCSQEVAAVGIHVTLQPYGVEIGAWNGENPEFIAEMISAEVTALQAGGVYTCTKHYITRGGDASYSEAQSIAKNYENYMYCWQAAIDAGTRWIMTNGKGLVDGITIDYDQYSLKYLREELGYDGVVVTDWGAVNTGASGVVDGTNLAELGLKERYAWMITCGVDQLGINNLTLHEEKAAGNEYYVIPMDEAIDEGLLAMDVADAAVKRLLLTKFDLGLFEDPYSNPGEALAIAASAEYVAERWDIETIDDLDRARNPEVVELDRIIMAESAVLVKNDDVLPLQDGIKVYFDSNASETNKTEISAAIASYCEVVDNMADADVVVADCAVLDDAAELMIEDAKDAGKTLVIVTNNVDPDTMVMEEGDAVIFMNYDRTPDHGTALNGFVLTTEPVVYAELLFGVREPGGMIIKEIARDSAQEDGQWADLAGDMGANQWVRLMLEAYMLTSGDYSTPENWGDPLLCYKYGMKYGESPGFRYSTLVVPQEKRVVEEYPEFWGSNMESIKTVNTTKVGEAFTINCLLWNDGADGVTTTEVYVDGALVAEKIMAVNGGSWRIVEFEIVIDEAGDHELTVGDLTTTITVE